MISYTGHKNIVQIKGNNEKFSRKQKIARERKKITKA